MVWFKKISFLFYSCSAILVCSESVIKKEILMSVLKKMVARVKVELMPVRDFSDWMKKLEAKEAIA